MVSVTLPLNSHGGEKSRAHSGKTLSMGYINPFNVNRIIHRG